MLPVNEVDLPISALMSSTRKCSMGPVKRPSKFTRSGILYITSANTPISDSMMSEGRMVASKTTESTKLLMSSKPLNNMLRSKSKLLLLVSINKPLRRIPLCETMASDWKLFSSKPLSSLALKLAILARMESPKI